MLVVEKFNNILEETVTNLSWKYIDTYSITKDKNGISNQKYMADEFHLHPKIFKLIENKIS